MLIHSISILADVITLVIFVAGLRKSNNFTNEIKEKQRDEDLTLTGVKQERPNVIEGLEGHLC